MLEQEQGSAVEAPIEAVTLGIGESTQEQAAPLSTVARERMVEIIANNTKVIADCNEMLTILNNRPDLDSSFCRLFGITKTPGIKDIK